jgi:acetoin utilization protein AcuC
MSNPHTLSTNVGVVVSERPGTYGFPEGHPLGPDRLGAFLAELRRRGLAERVLGIPDRLASREELLSFHTEEHIRAVEAASQRGYGLLDGGDTPAFPGVYEAASCVVGSVLNAVDAILDGTCRRAFVPIAGLHHARPDGAAGFCVFNDCGVAIRRLLSRGLQRVAYIDIDAHHGDGVFYAFEEDPVVIFADLHEDGRFLYPGTGSASETGRGAAVGTKLNFPLPPGADDAVFDRLWPQVIAHVERFKPEAFILQCGADSIAGDPIAHLRFTPKGAHGRAARELTALAQAQGHGRVLALGGGGYNRTNIAQAWNVVVEGLLSDRSL